MMSDKWIKYLIEDRKLNEETMERFQLGYCNDNLECDLRFGFPSEAVSYVPNKMKDSILIPLYNIHGVIVAIQCRSFQSSKYNATSYVKGEILYGLSLVWQDILEKGSVFLVEGVFDVMSLWKRGIRNVVSPLGTSLSDNQTALLMRFTNRVIIAFDSDEAGNKGTRRVIDKLSEQHVLHNTITFPAGFDPDEFICTAGPTPFIEEMKQEEPILDTLKRRLEWDKQKQETLI